MQEDQEQSQSVAGIEKTNPYRSHAASVQSHLPNCGIRSRLYTGVLIFIVAVGLPIIGVPKLRQRLAGRVQVLHRAWRGPLINLVTLKVGENNEPFPEEYVSPNSGVASVPQFAPVQLMPHPSLQTAVHISDKVSRPTAGQPAKEVPLKAGDSAVNQAADQQATDSGPQFQQGKVEKEAYDLLIQSDTPLSDMVSGKNPAFRFKSWSAAKRQEEGSYLVDLAFTKMPEDQEEHFIWQVNLLSKQITPMSYNAKNIPKP
jgi:hypothetical protein